MSPLILNAKYCVYVNICVISLSFIQIFTVLCDPHKKVERDCLIVKSESKF